MRQLFLILFGPLFFLACSTGDSEIGASTGESEVVIPEHLQDVENLTVLSVDSVPQYEIELVRETNYGDKYDDVVFLGFINEFEVDDEGRVYLADMSNENIHVYNPDGTFLRSIGRAGRGPGEFLTLHGGLEIGVNDEYLVGFDDTNDRISRFSLETFELVDVVNVDPTRWNHIDEISSSRPRNFYFRNDGTYIVNFSVVDFNDSESGLISIRDRLNRVGDGHASYFLFNHKFDPVSGKILEEDFPEYTMTPGSNGSIVLYSFPFTNQNLISFSESGYIYKASSEEFLISIHEPDGTYLRSIYYPVEAVPFTDQDREKLLEERSSYGRGFSEFGVADQWPVLNQIIVDDENRLWISIITEDYSTTEWWVLDEHDNLIGRFSWPRNLMDQPGDEADDYIIKNGALYYLSTESMSLDEQTVIKYRIEMKPIGSEQ